MTLKIGRNRNTNDAATISAGILVDAVTSVTIATANPDRIGFHVNNNSAVRPVWVKLQPASVDNLKKGIYLAMQLKGKGDWNMPPDNPYTGEISAIADSGTELVYVTEW